MPSSVTSTSTSLERRRTGAASRRRSWWSRRARPPWRALATMARLVAASSRSGVVRPCSTLMPLVPRKATSARRSASGRDGVGADGRLRGRAHPAGQQVQSSICGRPASRAATGTAWVTTVSRWSRGSSAGEPAGGGAGVDQRPSSRSAGSSASAACGDPRPSRRCWRGRARRRRTRSRVSELAGTAPPCTRRTRPIRSSAERSRRTVSVVTSNGPRRARSTDRRPRCATQLGHRLLPFLGVHRASGRTLCADHCSVYVLFYTRMC